MRHGIAPMPLERFVQGVFTSTLTGICLISIINGAMLEGFQSVNGNCYYLDSDSGGALECNAWVFSQDAYAYYACSSGAIVLTGVMDSVGAIRRNDAEGKPHSRLVLVLRCSDLVLRRSGRGVTARLAIN